MGPCPVAVYTVDTAEMYNAEVIAAATCPDDTCDYRGSCGTAYQLWRSPGISASMNGTGDSGSSLNAAGSANAAASRTGGGADTTAHHCHPRNHSSAHC